MIYVLIPTTPERKKNLARAIKSVVGSICDQPITILVDVNNYEGAVKPLIRLFNMVDGVALFLGDDAEVLPYTIQIAYNTYMRTFPDQDGMCATVDALTNQVNMCHPLAHTRTFLENTHPGYFHNFVDKEWFDVSQIKSKYVESLGALIVHTHFSRNGVPIDKTYEVGQGMSDVDGKLYNERRAKKFDL